MKKTTIAKAIEAIMPVIKAHLPLARIDKAPSGGVRADIECGWGVDASLSIAPWFEGNPHKLCLRVSVGWSSMKFSPAHARAAAILHSQMADVACLLEAMISNLGELVETVEEVAP